MLKINNISDIKSQESFQNWCKKKVKIENFKDEKWLKNGQFWLFNVGINVGGEMSVENPFVRPCMILKAKLGGDMILIVPLSTKIEGGYIKEKFYREVENFEEHGLDKKGYFVLNQVKVISKKRLITQLSGKQPNGNTFKRYSVDALNKLKLEVFDKVIK